MKIIIRVVLIIILVSLIIVNIYLLNKTKICKISNEYDYYKENITIKINRFKKSSMEKNYTFENEDILNKEYEKLVNNNYDVKINKENLSIGATKNIKNSNYYKIVKEYKEKGYSCN